MTPNANDLIIRVKVDATQPKQEMKKIEDSARNIGKAGGLGIGNLAGKGVLGLAAAIFGPSMLSLAGAGADVLGNIGRATSFGKFAARSAAIRDAQKDAMQQTADMFGAVGSSASRGQILSIYDALNEFKRRENTGRSDVIDVISEERRDRDLQAVTDPLVNAIHELIDHLKNTFGGGQRPTIK